MVTQRLPSSSTTETCQGVLECTSAELLALGAAVFLLFFLATVVDLEDALSVVDSERSRILAEADAFDAFASRVAELDPTRSGGTTARPGAGTLVEASGQSQLRQVREAYRTTLMSVSHYDAEYGEPLPQNMAVEFGDDVAAAVVHDVTLTPRLKETILERSRQARDQRLTLAEYLDEEASALSRASDELGRVARTVDRMADQPLERLSPDDLRAEWYLIEDRIEECERVLRQRQETIRSRGELADRVANVDSLAEYIYEPLSVDYPILSVGTELADQLDDAQDRIARVVSTWE